MAVVATDDDEDDMEDVDDDDDGKISAEDADVRDDAEMVQAAIDGDCECSEPLVLTRRTFALAFSRMRRCFKSTRVQSTRSA